jgi:XTP/dITP diphosphohydrolase
MHTKEEKMEAFGRFLDILDELRIKCPWDRKQTNDSLRPNTIEETYELCDAIIRDDKSDICKELGDVLLHIAFYAKIGSEKGDFDIKDVCDRLCEKLIYRHPHVFGDEKAETAGQVSENWEQLKLKEKGGNTSVLSGVPSALPALIKAYRIQDKARNVGFDWENREQVWDKVKEEILEFQQEIANMDKDKAEAEFGDVLFSLINAARLYKINPDNALERTNQKFISRFNYLEEHTIKKGRSLHDMTLEEMDEIWNQPKKKKKKKRAATKTPRPHYSTNKNSNIKRYRNIEPNTYLSFIIHTLSILLHTF